MHLVRPSGSIPESLVDMVKRAVGGGKLYWNGRPLATVRGDGSYLLPVPSPADRTERGNVLAAALYGLSPETGLYSAEVSADEDRMTRRRALEIRF